MVVTLSRELETKLPRGEAYTKGPSRFPLWRIVSAVMSKLTLSTRVYDHSGLQLLSEVGILKPSWLLMVKSELDQLRVPVVKLQVRRLVGQVFI
jgi:hypothetical protein